MANKKKLIFLGLGTFFLAAGLIYGLLWFTHYRHIQTTDNAYVESDISVISPKVSGYLASVNVAENAYVHKNDILAVIEPRDYEIALDQARARLETQKAAIATIAERIAAQEAAIESARANVAASEAQAGRARADYARYQALARQDFASKQKLEAARADTQSSDAGLASVRAALTAAQAQTGVLQAQKAEEEKRLAQVMSEIDQTERNLSYTIIRAPIDGVLGNKHMDVGQLVQPGAQLASLVALPHVYVEANFKETQIGRMKIGQAARIVSDAFPGIKITGRVESFSPASGQIFSLLPAENATGNFTKVVQRIPVRIAVPDDNELRGRLRPGLSVTVSVDTRTAGEESPAAQGHVSGAAPRPAAALAHDAR